MAKVYAPGVHAIRYIGSKPIPFRARRHGKPFSVEDGDIILVDDMTAILLARRLEYERVEEYEITISTSQDDESLGSQDDESLGSQDDESLGSQDDKLPSKMNKVELIAYAQSLDIEVGEELTKAQIRALVEEAGK